MSRIKYVLDTSGLEFEVAKTAVPKVDERGVQKIDQASKYPVWNVELTVYMGEDAGADTMNVGVASPEKPDVQWRQPVQVVDLEMIPWSSKGRQDRDPIRSGVAFRAKEIRPVEVAALRNVA